MVAALRVRTSMTGPVGAPYLNTLFFTGEDQTAADGAAAAAHSFWTALAGNMGGGTTISVEPTVSVIDEDGNLIAEFATTSTPISTSGESDVLPFTTQGLIRWSTGVVILGRPLRGRTFVPVPLETNSTNGRPNAPYIGDCTDAGQALLDDADSELVIFSKATHQFRPVVGVSCWNNWAELRSRRD